MDNDCLFCKIAAKKIPAFIIYEDAHAVAFFDIMPRTTGHAMVVSKYHASGLCDLPDEEIAPFFLAVKAVDDLLLRALCPDGMTIGINQGKASGQEVDHLHVHLMPRWNGDGGRSIHAVVHNPPKESVEEIFRKIKGSL